MVKQDLADNPYQSPGELHASAETETGSKESEDGRPTSKGDVSGFGLGYLAWALPIAAWIPLIAMIVIATPGLHNLILVAGILICFCGGTLFTLFNVIATNWNPDARRHALYGLTFNGLLIFLVIVACAGLGTRG